jgi:hypothetical protein
MTRLLLLSAFVLAGASSASAADADPPAPIACRNQGDCHGLNPCIAGFCCDRGQACNDNSVCCPAGQSCTDTICCPNGQMGVVGTNSVECCATDKVCGPGPLGLLTCCKAGEACQNGQCHSQAGCENCAPGTICCNGTCGSVCGTDCCNAGDFCCGGVECVAKAFPQFCCNDRFCNPQTEQCVSGNCCPTAQACGSNCCAAGEACANGCCASRQCGTGCCTASETCVNAACVATSSLCLAGCPSGTTCKNGSCVPVTPPQPPGCTCPSDHPVCLGTSFNPSGRTCLTHSEFDACVACVSGWLACHAACTFGPPLCTDICDPTYSDCLKAVSGDIDPDIAGSFCINFP